MSFSTIILTACVILYFGCAVGTILKYSHRMKLRYVPYFLFVLPLRVMFALWASVPMFSGFIGYVYLVKHETGRSRDKAIEDLRNVIEPNEIINDWLNNL